MARRSRASGRRVAGRRAAWRLAAAAIVALPSFLSCARGSTLADARARASSPPALPPIVFVSREPIRDPDGAASSTAVPGIGPVGRTAAFGGRLLVREPDGTVRALAEAARFWDVADPSVSWDGKRVAFSAVEHPDSSWRIYEILADGSGLRALTQSDRNVALSPLGAAARRFERYDDVDPCWLPDGRIAFASTRYPAISEGGDFLATNLFVVERDGTCLARITTERSGAEEPAIDPLTGRIVYARWWVNLDRPSNMTRDGITTLDHQALTDDIADIWQVVSIGTDGSGLRLHAGDPRSREGSVCYKPALLPDGRVLTLDAENGAFAPPHATGVRVFPPGAGSATHLLGFRRRAGEAPFARLADASPAVNAQTLSQAVAVDPCPLSNETMLVSYSGAGERDFGVYVTPLDRIDLFPAIDLPRTHELDAVPLIARPTPPILHEEFRSESAALPPTEDPATFLVNSTFRFDCLNVFANAPVDAPIPDAPRIGRGTQIRFFLNFQRKSSLGRDASILYRQAALSPQGGVHEHDIPAEVPMFEQLVDSAGHVVMTPLGKAAHVTGLNFARQGEGTKCVGCHAGHSVIDVARNYSTATWFNVATSADVSASSEWTPAGAAGSGASPYPGGRVVDRRARNDSLDVAWVAAGREGEHVTLSWPIPIQVREFVLYGVRHNQSAGTDLQLESCGITLLRDGKIVGQVEDTGRISPDGTSIAVPQTVIDAARLDIRATKGHIQRLPLAGMAEIEVIARLAD